jgi:hypothetical protein
MVTSKPTPLARTCNPADIWGSKAIGSVSAVT